MRYFSAPMLAGEYLGCYENNSVNAALNGTEMSMMGLVTDAQTCIDICKPQSERDQILKHSVIVTTEVVQHIVVLFALNCRVEIKNLSSI